MKRCLACGVFVALILGCGNNGDKPTGETGSTDSPGKQVAVAAKPWDPAAGTATLQGVVKFLGKPPKRRPIDMAGKTECAQHATPVLDESLIVHPDGSLKNVFVWVKTGLKGWKFTPPTTPVVLDQKGCMFHPHVQGVQVRQAVVLRNSDAFAHNLRCTAILNPAFNFTQVRQGQEDTRQFDRPEVLFKIKCDLHGWMGTYLGVVEHPFFEVTGDDGRFVLRGLPAGEFTVEAVHEELGRKTLTIKVADKDIKDVGFDFSP